MKDKKLSDLASLTSLKSNDVLLVESPDHNHSHRITVDEFLYDKLSITFQNLVDLKEEYEKRGGQYPMTTKSIREAFSDA